MVPGSSLPEEQPGKSNFYAHGKDVKKLTKMNQWYDAQHCHVSFWPETNNYFNNNYNN